MRDRKLYKKCIFAFILAMSFVANSAYPQNSIQPKRFPHGLILKNSHLKMVLTEKGNLGIERQVYARKKSGEWKLVLEGFNPRYPKNNDSAVQLWNMDLNPYRHLITGIQGKILSNKKANPDDSAIVIRMSHHGSVITEKITLHGEDDYFHIEVNAVFSDTNPKLDYLLSSYTILNQGMPDFVHTPGVKFDDPRSGAGKNQVTGDRAFLAPAVIFQKDDNFVSLVPDLNAANRLRVVSKDARRQYIEPTQGPFTLPFIDSLFTMPTGIDLNLNSGVSPYPVLTYGLMDANIGFHTRFIRNEFDKGMVRTLYGNEAGYAFDLFVSTSFPPYGYQEISRHQWQQYGSPLFNNDYHLAMPLKEYVKLIAKTIFNPIRDSLGEIVRTPGGKMDSTVDGYKDNGSWLEWVADGVKMGGFRCSAPFWDDVINNSPYWNQARDAVGIYYWGKELNDPSLIQKAREVINFCLSAPRNPDGLFSTVFSARDKSWGTAWTDPPNGKNRLFLRNSNSYEIPALCKTGAHLLDYYLRQEKDARILEYLHPFAEWLLTVIDDRGIVPSYVTKEMESSAILYESAQPAAAMWFLAEMYNATKESKFLDGAEKIAVYLEREIIPSAKWIDSEQYISCGSKPYSFQKDYWQGQWFRGSLCLIWATEGFSALHRATFKNQWLSDGEKCADYLSFNQCVWRPHYIYTANPFGGFVTDNSDDANMMDQRQAEVVKPFIYLGKKLGRKDLIERAVAAAEAACTLIIHPRHIANKVFQYPLFYPVGVAPENIDHEGLPQCPMRTHPLWGEGSAVFTGLSEAYRSLGGLFIDPVKDLVVGVDGIKINSVTRKDHTIKIEAESFLSPRFLNQPWEYAYTSNIEIENITGYTVELNGIILSKSAQGRFETQILPDGNIVSNK